VCVQHQEFSRQPVQFPIILKFDRKPILDSTRAKRQTACHCTELMRGNHRVISSIAA
jgi:hypothetical protein